MKTSFILTIFFIINILSVSNPAWSAEKKLVFVSILPQKFFVQQISGDLLDIEVMVPPGANPATYEPKPSQMRKLATSKAYFAIGVPFEKAWLTKISAINTSMQVVHTDAGIPKLTMASHHHEEDRLAHNEKDSGLDPHIWLSPLLAQDQVRIITDTLITLFPHHREDFLHNCDTLLAELQALDSGLQKQLAPVRGKRFMVFHPSWGYFAKQYGLQQIAMEQEGKDPKTGQLEQIIAFARENNIEAILAQSQFSTKSASIVAREINGKVIIVDPLAYDYINNLHHVADELVQIMK